MRSHNTARPYSDSGDNLARQGLRIALPQHTEAHNEIARCREMLRLRPADGEAHYALGCLLFQNGKTEEAIIHMQKALDLLPDDGNVQRALAWLLSTASPMSLRNGAAALQLAVKANQTFGGRNPLVLRTLAAAYAQQGDFPDAVRSAREALEIAKAGADGRLAGSLLREIKLYEAGRPFEDVR